MGQTALCALVAIVALGRGAIALGAGGLRDVRAADLVAAHSLGTLPPSAVLFTGNFETAALVSYQRLVEGRRPDVAWVHLGFARGPGYAERVSRAEPDLADVLRDYQQRRLDYAPLEALDRTRPVHIEPVGDFTPRAGHHLRPCGLAWCFERERSNQVQTGSRWPPWMATILWQQATTSPEIFHYLVWKIYLDADFACRARRPEARGFLGALAHQAPEDVWARTLLRDCKDRYRLGFDLLAPRGRGIARAR